MPGLGRIGEDQVKAYAASKGWTKGEAERWLAPILDITQMKGDLSNHRAYTHASAARLDQHALTAILSCPMTCFGRAENGN